MQGFEAPTADGKHGLELSGGLVLTLATEPTRPPECAPQMPPVVFEQFAGLLSDGQIEAALDRALNSDGDALQLELSGNLEVPVFPAVTAGGRAGFKAGVQRGTNSAGAVVYDVTIAADAAASAGVGAGVAGAGASLGIGDEIVWRFLTTHEVAHALRCFAITQAIGPNLANTAAALDRRLDDLDRAVRSTRALIDHVRNATRGWLPWSHTALGRRLQATLDRLRTARRALADRSRDRLGALIVCVAEAKRFLDAHAHAIELHATSTIEANAGTSFGDAKTSGSYTIANVGASVAASIERQFAMRVERVEESGAMSVENKVTFTKSIVGAAGAGIGAAAAGKRVLEVSCKAQFDANGLQLGETGTTVKLTLDGRILGALGAVVTGQFGVGGEVVASLRLRDLLDYSADAMSIALGDDDDRIVRLLRAVPVQFRARGRYEAGLALGFGVDLDGVFKAGIGGSAMLIDCGTAFEYQGCPEGHGIGDMLTAGPLAGIVSSAQTTFTTVHDQVAHVTQP